MSSSDQNNALTYVIEGEAELFTVYYSYKMYYGVYPTTSAPIVDLFNSWSYDTEQELESLHMAGEPLIRILPMIWAYYSYGPLFIDNVSQGNWQIIDNQIFQSLPIKTREVIDPSNYTTDRKEYLLDMDPFLTSLNSTQKIMDVDELGYVLTYDMFKEWDYSAPEQIASDLIADNIVVYRGLQDDSLRLVWYTKWDRSDPSEFISAYKSIIEKKRNIVLPSGENDSSGYVMNDTIHRILIESVDSTVIIMEDYLPSYVDGWLEQLHRTKAYLHSTT